MTWLFCACGLIAACGGSGTGSVSNSAPPAPQAPAGPPANAQPAERQGKPQPRLETDTFLIGTNQIVAELALREREIQTGMMWRTELGEMEGMLFVFPFPRQTSFWMKNCPLPMTCAYLDSEGEVLEIIDMEPFNEEGLLAKTDRVQYVLEMNRGWFKRHNVNVGAVLTTRHGSLRDRFRRYIRN